MCSFDEYFLQLTIDVALESSKFFQVSKHLRFSVTLHDSGVRDIDRSRQLSSQGVLHLTIGKLRRLHGKESGIKPLYSPVLRLSLPSHVLSRSQANRHCPKVIARRLRGNQRSHPVEVSRDTRADGIGDAYDS
ncbi:hypothetical protein FVEG_16771 [Fusarium verticillioides 7600]|uniref:Uncharacterized protein n=1 Tax=Gibberella moniliformis (strain M3125 / FGSC 7600) TaxID=334819 RepID=W7N370_GIBM7|nr:hypothetical protein FVEG_16771 [Fusarium verticillioides 7600]EWG51212.1 hypothetical protein FVEG_16771 [Fusarium verticillioides 7600]